MTYNNRLRLERPIYLDNMATTPVDPRVCTKMMRFLSADGVFGNSQSHSHTYGLAAAQAVEEARLQVASVIGANPNAIVFTSGATEANNLAILGAARFYKRKGCHVITVATEHKSVLDSFAQLAREGFEVTYLIPSRDGLIDPEQVAQAIRPDTILVSVMQVNNEIGVIQDLAAIAACVENKGIIFHVDAAQSVGRVALDVREIKIDLMSLSAHKAYGPKGIGALYVRDKPRVRLSPQSFGGGQESGLRAGTLPTHQIIGMGEAYTMAEALRMHSEHRLACLRDRLWERIATLPHVIRNGHLRRSIGGLLSVTFRGIPPEELLSLLHPLALSSTSACASAQLQPSYVLKAIGLSDQDAYSTIRIALGRFNNQDEIDFAAQWIVQSVNHFWGVE